MRKLVFLIFAFVSPAALAQTAQDSSARDEPIEITASGGTTYEGGIATARDNVRITIGDTDIYADAAQYNAETKEVRLQGNVRIYRGAELYVGESGTYNTETKAIEANQLRTLDLPFYLGGERISSISENATLVQKGSFTTHDAYNPDFQLRATTVRVYDNDRIILKNVTLYIGRVPVFYFPYLYQSLNDAFSFVISPAYMSSWGPSILSRVSFPITGNIKATVRLDYRVRRGLAAGFDADMKYGKNNSSYAKLKTYFIKDENPNLNRTSLPRGAIPDERYRISLANRTNFGHDIHGIVGVAKLSDPFVLQDFFQADFRINPTPDNLVSLTKYNPLYSLTAYTRFQLNDFYEVTERLPEIALDIKRQPLFGSPVFYEGEASFSNLRRNFPEGALVPDYDNQGDANFANLRRNFPEGALVQDYDTVRLDTFHQLTYPNTYFGWLSVVPRVGFRATYYTDSRDINGLILPRNPNPLLPDFLLAPLGTVSDPLRNGGDAYRLFLNTGVEASFKLSHTWEQVQNRRIGLDGLRHIVQPFINYSYVVGQGANPAEILQFDRYIPSARLRPVDFPQFTSIDSIDDWSIARVGVRNRLQTRRDDATINWAELETYFDINFHNPYDRTNFSNVFNNLSINPVPWVSFGIGSQLPLIEEGFTEINTAIRVQPIPSLAVSFEHRFMNENPFFTNSSLYTAGLYYRINDHWAAGASARYEASTGFLEEQRYTIYRDLTSWVASLGGIIRNNGGVKEYGVLLTFTVKALPKFNFNLSIDPGAPEGEENASGIFP